MKKAEIVTIREFRAKLSHYIANMQSGHVYTLKGVDIGCVHEKFNKDEKACTPKKEEKERVKENMGNGLNLNDQQEKELKKMREHLGVKEDVCTSEDKPGTEKFVAKQLEDAGFDPKMAEDEEKLVRGEGVSNCDVCRKMTKQLYCHWENERGEMEICYKCARQAWNGPAKMFEAEIAKKKI